MSDSAGNLLLDLDRWALGQHENFLTDIFAHLLRRLRDRQPEIAAGLTGQLTGGHVALSDEQLARCEIRTQVQADTGSWPDMEISAPGLKVFVEVKDRSPVDPDQLRRYSKVLRTQCADERCLVLLTRYAAPAGLDVQYLRPPVRWSQVGDWLQDVVHQQGSRIDPVTGHVVREFLRFLGGKGMTVERVGYQLAAGIEELRRLRQMVREALDAHGVSSAWAAGSHNYTGYGVRYRDGESTTMYVLIDYDEPSILVFSVAEWLVPEGSRAGWGLEGGLLHKGLDLESEEVHFFARSAHSQLQVIEEFVGGCLGDIDFDPRLEKAARTDVAAADVAGPS